MDQQAKHNKGYAFINLINQDIAWQFVEHFNGVRFEGASSKSVHICRARAQGVLPNLRTLTHTNWSKKEHMPIFRIQGELLHLTPLAAYELLRIEREYG